MDAERKILQVTSFGGVSFIMAKMKALGVPELFDSMLGKRVRQARYSYGDAFLGWMYCNLCGAKRLDDINSENFYQLFKNIPIARLGSHDHIGRVLKRFATKTEKYKSSKSLHELNRNPLMNNLLLHYCKLLGLLNESEEYLLDYDSTTIPTEKTDAKMTYKKIRGYSPAVMLIGKIPVSIEGRNGNTNASYKVLEALQEMYRILQSHNIKTSGIRMDAASYQKKVMYWLDEKVDGKARQKFYIRATNTQNAMPDISLAYWKEYAIHGRKEEIGDVEFYPFDNDHKFRYVVSRYPNPKPSKKKPMIYRAIVTNEMEKIPGTSEYKISPLEIIRLYDQRGDSENNFRDLLNDFNWRRVPFMDMNENMVYLYVGAMAKCLYEYTIQAFGAQKETGFEAGHKLKKFVAYFVKRVSVTWERNGEDWSFDLLNMRDKFEALQRWAVKK